MVLAHHKLSCYGISLHRGKLKKESLRILTFGSLAGYQHGPDLLPPMASPSEAAGEVTWGSGPGEGNLSNYLSLC